MENYKIKEIIVDMDKKSYNQISLKQGEVNGNKIKAKLIFNCLEFIPKDIAECKVFYKKPDGKRVIQDDINYNSNTSIVEFFIPNQAIAIDGQGEMEIVLYSKDNKTISGLVPLRIERSLSGEIEESRDDWGKLDKAFQLAKNSDEYNQAESQRKANEILRVSNENTRIVNDNKRLGDESTRIKNEDVRLSNEKARQDLYDKLKESKSNYDKAVLEGSNSNLEIIEARKDKLGKVYNTIGDRLDNLDNTSLMKFKTDATLTKLENVQDGYLTDVVMKGKTLVNLIKFSDWIKDGVDFRYRIIVNNLKVNTNYTFYTPLPTNIVSGIYKNGGVQEIVGYSETPIKVFNTGTETSLSLYLKSKDNLAFSNISSIYPVLLEGSYTTIPSYFEGIKSVGEVNYIEGKYIGKNLFNGEYQKKFIQGGDSKNRLLDNPDTRSAIIPIEAGGKYLIKKHSESNRFTICLYNSLDIGVEATQAIDTSKSSSQVTFTNTSNSKYMIIYISNSKEEPLLMVEKGELFSEYESYYEGSKIDILSISKNLYKVNEAKFNGADRIYLINRNINLPNEVYAINNTDKRVIFGVKDKATNVYIRESVVGSNSSFNFKLESNEYIENVTALFRDGWKETDLEYLKNNIMVTGVLDTNQETYKYNKTEILSKEPLREWDILKNNGIIERNSRQVILSGRESWTTVPDAPNQLNTMMFGLIPSDIKPSAGLNILSDKFITYSLWLNDVEGICCPSTSRGLWIRVSKDKVRSLDEFKQFLAKEKPIVVYPLENKVLEVNDKILNRWDAIRDNGYIEKYSKRKVLDGAENWSIANPPNSENIVNTNLFAVVGFSDNQVSEKDTVICDKFFNTPVYRTDEEGIYISTGGILYLRIYKTKAKDLTELKTYLAKERIEIIYKLQTPVIERVVDNYLKIRTFKNGYIQQNTIISAAVEGQYPISLGGSIKSNTNAIEQMEKELGGAWKTLLNLVDKELKMLTIEPLTGTDLVSKKVNEILSVWR